MARTLEQLTEPQRRLAAEHLPLARALARPLKARYPDCRDDFESAACLALVESARTYRPEVRTRFTTLAHHRIKGALTDVLRDRAERAGRAFAHSDLDASGITFVAETPDRRSRVEDALIAAESFERLIRRLPPAHGQVCRLIYQMGYRQVHAARAMSLSPTRVCALHAQALALLAAELAPEPTNRATP